MTVYLNAEPVTGYRIHQPVWDDLRVPANALLEMDFHILLDTQGSKTEYAK